MDILQRNRYLRLGDTIINTEGLDNEDVSQIVSEKKLVALSAQEALHIKELEGNLEVTNILLQLLLDSFIDRIDALPNKQKLVENIEKIHQKNNDLLKISVDMFGRGYSWEQQISLDSEEDVDKE